ncbi:hypothetical protein BDZ89DRAFT_1043010 [Hymenopellis radicata]|nr:hypothetical protein BDZ89DRAFT_1043010 [Hymenopellis radicata]
MALFLSACLSFIMVFHSFVSLSPVLVTLATSSPPDQIFWAPQYSLVRAQLQQSFTTEDLGKMWSNYPLRLLQLSREQQCVPQAETFSDVFDYFISFSRFFVSVPISSIRAITEKRLLQRTLSNDIELLTPTVAPFIIEKQGDLIEPREVTSRQHTGACFQRPSSEAACVIGLHMSVFSDGHAVPVVYRMASLNLKVRAEMTSPMLDIARSASKRVIADIKRSDVLKVLFPKSLNNAYMHTRFRILPLRSGRDDRNSEQRYSSDPTFPRIDELLDGVTGSPLSVAASRFA